MGNPKKRPVVLAIAGFDPSGGAGVLADIKAIAAFDCYGVAAVTSLTFQNTNGVVGALNQESDTVRQQIIPLLNDFEIAAIKTGLLPTAAVVRGVAELIRPKGIPVVVDPVLKSTSGFNLSEEKTVDAYRSDLFPVASLVTPNVAEAERITGVCIEDQNQMRQAAEIMLGMGARAVLVTGGDADGQLATDLLVDADGTILFESERINSKDTHGTGCTLSSAIACLLAQGYPLRESIAAAKDYVKRAILRAPGLGRGHGPLDHFPAGLRGED